MLLNAIILILRETLEAGVLISLLYSIGARAELGARWILISSLIGAIGAVIYARNFSLVSEWFEYVGQEVVNAAMQLGIWFSLTILSAILIFKFALSKRNLALLMGFAVVTAITREGSEILIFYSGFLQNEGALLKAITSGFVGLAIGLSVGILFYYSIVLWSARTTRYLQIALCALVAAGVSVQATQLLMQIDWLPSLKPLWNSSWLLSEPSILGQVTYAVFGYESTPSAIEVSFYLSTVVVVLSMLLIRWVCHTRKLAT